MVEAQRATKSLASHHAAVVIRRRAALDDERVSQALVRAFAVIVLDEFGDEQTKMTLTKWHDMVQALGLDREHEALRVGVQIRTLHRQLDGRHVGAERFAEPGTEERLTILDELPLAAQKPIDDISQVARYLLHPRIYLRAGFGWASIRPLMS